MKKTKPDVTKWTFTSKAKYTITQNKYQIKLKPGLLALYYVRPGNASKLFLQPRSSHGAAQLQVYLNIPPS